jgi:hypothetical protein
MVLGPLAAEQIVPKGDLVVTANRKPAGYQQIVGLVASTALTVPTDAKVALIQTTAQNVRWRDDGVAPTTTVGMQMLTTSAPLEYSGDLSAFRAIQELATATLNVSYYF